VQSKQFYLYCHFHFFLRDTEEHHHRMEEGSGVESSMTEGELKQYLGKALTEIKHTTNDPLK
jgi:hypothetical protein